MPCAGCSDCKLDADLSAYGKDSYPFQVHHTLKGATFETLSAVCQELGLKPLAIEMNDTHGRPVVHLMTNGSFVGTYDEAFRKAMTWSDQLQERGLSVARTKIETVPWHPEADKILQFPNRYVETHYHLSGPLDWWPALQELAWEQAVLFPSRNLVPRSDGNYDFYLTYRTQQPRVVREARQEQLRLVIAEKFEVRKVLTEFSIFDDHEGLDDAWLQKEE